MGACSVGACSVERVVWSVQCGACSVERAVWSVQCGSV